MILPKKTFRKRQSLKCTRRTLKWAPRLEKKFYFEMNGVNTEEVLLQKWTRCWDTILIQIWIGARFFFVYILYPNRIHKHIPNEHKISTKFTQIGMVGLKINHLATLTWKLQRVAVQQRNLKTWPDGGIRTDGHLFLRRMLWPLATPTGTILINLHANVVSRVARFSWSKHTNVGKIYKMTTIYNKRS
jgi:hypothetical protein